MSGSVYHWGSGRFPGSVNVAWGSRQMRGGWRRGLCFIVVSILDKSSLVSAVLSGVLVGGGDDV